VLKKTSIFREFSFPKMQLFITAGLRGLTLRGEKLREKISSPMFS
jgi:hypothetical protein